MTQYDGLLTRIPPFTVFTAEWCAHRKNVRGKMGGMGRLVLYEHMLRPPIFPLFTMRGTPFRETHQR